MCYNNPLITVTAVKYIENKISCFYIYKKIMNSKKIVLS